MSSKGNGYRIFDHTADVGLEVWGKSLESLFEAAAKGLFSLIADADGVGASVSFEVHVSAAKADELFLAWLKELLHIFYTRKILLSEFRMTNIKQNRLSAEVSGETLDPEKHRLGREVKAVTHHLFEFKQTGEGYKARVILDI